jgi:allantoate deiminase
MGLQHLPGKLSCETGDSWAATRRKSMKDPADTILQRIAALARISDEPGCLTRTFGSPAMRRANRLVASWMDAAGMKVRQDAIGNLIGHYPAATRDAKLLLLGSHLDTVRNAGKFDGPLGVILAIACVEHLRQNHLRLPFALDVYGFADEEGVRYHTSYLGSRAAAGLLAPVDLRRKDAAGVALSDAIRRFGGQPARLARARLDPRRLLGYVEAHIEQGPVLEARNAAVGIATAIAGQSRFRYTFTGRAGHAGTTPMRLRRDALCAAAEFILAVEHYAARKPGLVATVGQVQAGPNVSNVIPGSVTLTLDVRHQTDSVRRSAGAQCQRMARHAGTARRVKVSAQSVEQTASVACSSKLSSLLERAAQLHQSRIVRLPSGAGHDAAILARIAPAAMLFVRCRGGLSHHPDESASRQDVRVALAVLNDFLRLLANEYGRR